MRLAVLCSLVALMGCGGHGTLGSDPPLAPIVVRSIAADWTDPIYFYDISNDGRTIAGTKYNGPPLASPILLRDFVEVVFEDGLDIDAIRAMSPEGSFALVKQFVEYRPGLFIARNFLWRVGTATLYPMFVGTTDYVRVSDTGIVEGVTSGSLEGSYFRFAPPDQVDYSRSPPPDPFETAIPQGYTGKLVRGFSANKRAAFGNLLRADGTEAPCVWLPNTGPKVIPDPSANDHISCVWSSDDGTRALVYVLLGDQYQTYLWTEDRGYLSMASLAGIAGAQPKDPRYWGLIARSANGRYFVLTHSLNLDEHYWIHVP